MYKRLSGEACALLTLGTESG